VPSTRELRRRISSVKNIAKTTKAMETVASSRMRRAQQTVIATRPYASKMLEIIRNLSQRVDVSDGAHPLLQQRTIKNVGVVMITGDKGLVGSLNSNVIRRTTRFILNEAGAPVNLVTVGKKGRDFMIRYGRNVVAEFTGMGAKPQLQDISGVGRLVTDAYISGQVDAVYLIYTDFINTLIQRPVMLKLLPIDPNAPQQVQIGVNLPEVDTTHKAVDYIYEPGPQQLLNALLPRFVEVLIYQALLESVASEQSAQMVAMKNATQNANDLVSDLTLTYNKVRQANITKEISEISAGADALKG